MQNIASNPNNSVWVSANAGSGKTKVLVDRIIRLLLQGVGLSNILCLTYTKAAAAEMLERLQKTINIWAVMSEQKLRQELEKILDEEINGDIITSARDLFFNFHDAPQKLPILTIHSFCQDLLHKFPYESCINPSFQVANDEQISELINVARIAVLREAAAQPDSEMAEMLDYLIDNLGEYNFNQWFLSINNHRHKMQYVLQNDDANAVAIDILYHKSNLKKGDNWQKLLQRELCDNDEMRKILKDTAIIFQVGSVNDQKMAQKITKYLHSEHTQKSLHEFAFDILTDKGTQNKVVPTKITTQKLPLKLFGEWHELNKRAELYFQKYHSLHSVKLSHALMLVAKSWSVHYQALKAQHSFVDYGDLLEKAHELLRSPDVANWVLYKLDGKIEHLLIDEAQDTSGLQWKITQNLTAELFAGQGANGVKSIFVVGDEKQSIFGFQGADAQQFMEQSLQYEARANAIGEQLHRVPLNVSFRSGATILEFVDATFAEYDWLHQSFRGQQNGRVCIYPVAAMQ